MHVVKSPCAPLFAVMIAMLASPASPLGAPAQAQTRAAEPGASTSIEQRADDVVALLNGEVEPEDIFTPSFRAAVADAHVRALGTRLTAQFGRALAVSELTPRDGASAAFAVRFERGVARGRITIAPDEANRISGLLITTTDSLAPEGDNAAAIAADLAALPGSVNAWFGPLGGTL